MVSGCVCVCAYLEIIGIANGWHCCRFGLKEKLAKRGHLNLAAHQAAVELCLLHALKKPLASICDVVEHDKSVFKMIWKCKIQPGADGQWDNVLVYPNKETEAALVYIFEQIGGQPEAESIAETAGEAEDVDQLAEEADDVFPEDLAGSPGLPFFGYSDVRDRGFLSLALDDSTKFAVRSHPYPVLLVPQLINIHTVPKTLLTTQRPLLPRPHHPRHFFRQRSRRLHPPLAHPEADQSGRPARQERRRAQPPQHQSLC